MGTRQLVGERPELAVAGILLLEEKGVYFLQFCFYTVEKALFELFLFSLDGFFVKDFFVGNVAFKIFKTFFERVIREEFLKNL